MIGRPPKTLSTVDFTSWQGQPTLRHGTPAAAGPGAVTGRGSPHRHRPATPASRWPRPRGFSTGRPAPGGADRRTRPDESRASSGRRQRAGPGSARSATGLVGLLVHDIADPYPSTHRGAQRFAGGRRSQVLLAGADARVDRIDAVAAFVAYRTDAIVLAGSAERSMTAAATELSRYIANGAGWSPWDRRAFRVRFTLNSASRGSVDLVRARRSWVTDFAVLAAPGTEHGLRRVEAIAMLSTGRPAAVASARRLQPGGASPRPSVWQDSAAGQTSGGRIESVSSRSRRDVSRRHQRLRSLGLSFRGRPVAGSTTFRRCATSRRP